MMSRSGSGVNVAVSGKSISSSSSSHSSLKKHHGGLRVAIDTKDKYSWQEPNKFWYAILCCAGCCGKLSYTAQLVLGVVCTGSIVFGFNLSLLNTSVSTIGGQFLWCGYQGYRGCDSFRLYSAFIQVAVFVGAAAGAMTAGDFVQTMGCRTVFFIADGIIAIGVVFSVVSNAFPALLVARLVVGVGVGILALAVPTYISEVTNARNRGSYGVLHQLLITLGILVGVLLGIAFSVPPAVPDGAIQPTAAQMAFRLTTFDEAWWRVMLGLGIIPIIAQFILFQWVFTAETPYFLITHKKYSEAYAVLQKLNGKLDVETEFNEIYDLVESSSKQEKYTLSKVVESSNGRMALFVGTSISALQQLTGINVFITSSNVLFASAGLDQDLVTTMSIVLTLVNFLVTFPAIPLIEMLGRKLLLLIGTAGMGIAVLPGGVWLLIDENSQGATWTAIGGAIVFIISFSCTWGPVVWVYLFEIFPAEMKDAAAGIMVAANWIAGIAMVFAGSWMATEVGYIVFFCFNVIGFLFVLFFMKETRGRPIGDSPYF